MIKGIFVKNIFSTKKQFDKKEEKYFLLFALLSIIVITSYQRVNRFIKVGNDT